jgi:hypothetical protein
VIKELMFFKIYKVINLIHSRLEKFFRSRVGLCPNCKGSGNHCSFENGMENCYSCGGDGLVWSEGQYYASELYDMYEEYGEE